MTTTAPEPRKPTKAPKRVRQQLSEWEPGAHLYAGFGTHWRSGVASLIPFAVLYFTTQPFGTAMNSLASGGYTIGPMIVAVFATGWALMSWGLLHQLRFATSTVRHYIVYAVTGAAVLLAVSMLALTLIEWAQSGAPNPTTNSMLMGFLWASPLVGATGSVIGRRTLATGISWHRWLERPALPPVFDFVQGKRDKDDFERM